MMYEITNDAGDTLALVEQLSDARKVGALLSTLAGRSSTILRIPDGKYIDRYVNGEGTFATQLPEPVGTPNEILRGSEWWSTLLGVRVYDPDGWDRTNFEASWKEPITEAEFRARASVSTITGEL